MREGSAPVRVLLHLAALYVLVVLGTLIATTGGTAVRTAVLLVAGWCLLGLGILAVRTSRARTLDAAAGVATGAAPAGVRVTFARRAARGVLYAVAGPLMWLSLEGIAAADEEGGLGAPPADAPGVGDAAGQGIGGPAPAPDAPAPAPEAPASGPEAPAPGPAPEPAPPADGGGMMPQNTAPENNPPNPDHEQPAPPPPADAPAPAPEPAAPAPAPAPGPAGDGGGMMPQNTAPENNPPNPDHEQPVEQPAPPPAPAEQPAPPPPPPSPTLVDLDRDGIPDVRPDTPDADADGVPDMSTPGALDNDADGIPDVPAPPPSAQVTVSGDGQSATVTPAGSTVPVQVNGGSGFGHGAGQHLGDTAAAGGSVTVTSQGTVLAQGPDGGWFEYDPKTGSTTGANGYQAHNYGGGTSPTVGVQDRQDAPQAFTQNGGGPRVVGKPEQPSYEPSTQTAVDGYNGSQAAKLTDTSILTARETVPGYSVQLPGRFIGTTYVPGPYYTQPSSEKVTGLAAANNYDVNPDVAGIRRVNAADIERELETSAPGTGGQIYGGHRTPVVTHRRQDTDEVIARTQGLGAPTQIRPLGEGVTGVNYGDVNGDGSHQIGYRNDTVVYVPASDGRGFQVGAGKPDASGLAATNVPVKMQTAFLPGEQDDQTVVEYYRDYVARGKAVGVLIDDGAAGRYAFDSTAQATTPDGKPLADGVRVYNATTGTWTTETKPAAGGLSWYSAPNAAGERDKKALHEDGYIYATRAGTTTPQRVWTPGTVSEDERRRVYVTDDGTFVGVGHSGPRVLNGRTEGPDSLNFDGAVSCDAGGGACSEATMPTATERRNAVLAFHAATGGLTQPELDANGNPVLDKDGKPVTRTVSVEEAIAQADAASEERPAQFSVNRSDTGAGTIVAGPGGLLGSQYTGVSTQRSDVEGAPDITAPRPGLTSVLHDFGPNTQLAASPASWTQQRQQDGSTTFSFLTKDFDGKVSDYSVNRQVTNLPDADQYRVVTDKLPGGGSMKYQLDDSGQQVGWWEYDQTGKLVRTSTTRRELPTGDVVESAGTPGPTKDIDKLPAGRAVLLDGDKRIEIEIGDDGYVTAVPGHTLPPDLPSEFNRPSGWDRFKSGAVDVLGYATSVGMVGPVPLIADKTGLLPDNAWVRAPYNISQGPGRAVGGLLKGAVDLGELSYKLNNVRLLTDRDGWKHDAEHAWHTFKRWDSQVVTGDPYMLDQQGMEAFFNRHPGLKNQDLSLLERVRDTSFAVNSEIVNGPKGVIGPYQRLLVPDWDENPARATSTAVSSLFIPTRVPGLKAPGVGGPRPRGYAPTSTRPFTMTPDAFERVVVQSKGAPVEVYVPRGMAGTSRSAFTDPPTAAGGYPPMRPVGNGAEYRGTPAMQGGWSSLARPVPDPARPSRAINEPAIHAGSVPRADVADAFVRSQFPDTRRTNQPRYGTPGHSLNCANCVATAVERRAGVDVFAAARPRGKHIDDIARDYDLTPSDWRTRSSYDELIRHVRGRPVGSETVVYYAYRKGGAHVVNAINTKHGVVFLDDQVGGLARLPVDARLVKSLDVGPPPYGPRLVTQPDGRVVAVNPRQWPGLGKPAAPTQAGPTAASAASRGPQPRPAALKATGPGPRFAWSDELDGAPPRVDSGRQQRYLRPTATTRLGADVGPDVVIGLAARAAGLPKRAATTLTRSGKLKPAGYESGKVTVRFGRDVGLYRGRPTNTVVVRSNKAGEVYVEPVKPSKPAAEAWAAPVREEFYSPESVRARAERRRSDPALELSPGTPATTAWTESVGRTGDEWGDKLMHYRTLSDDLMRQRPPQSRAGKAAFVTAAVARAILNSLKAIGKAE